jgi:hypothetical protein
VGAQLRKKVAMADLKGTFRGFSKGFWHGATLVKQRSACFRALLFVRSREIHRKHARIARVAAASEEKCTGSMFQAMPSRLTT